MPTMTAVRCAEQPPARQLTMLTSTAFVQVLLGFRLIAHRVHSCPAEESVSAVAKAAQLISGALASAGRLFDDPNS